ncbi:unnamed protein product [Ophioblennius macclurei]
MHCDYSLNSVEMSQQYISAELAGWFELTTNFTFSFKTLSRVTMYASQKYRPRKVQVEVLHRFSHFKKILPDFEKIWLVFISVISSYFNLGMALIREEMESLKPLNLDFSGE